MSRIYLGLHVEPTFKEEIENTVNNFKIVYSEVSRSVIVNEILRLGMEELKKKSYKKSELMRMSWKKQGNITDEIINDFEIANKTLGIIKAAELCNITRVEGIKIANYLKVKEEENENV